MNIYKNYSVKINQAIDEVIAATNYQEVDRGLRRIERAWSSFCNDSDAATQDQRDMAHYKYIGTRDWMRKVYDQKRYGY